MAESFEMRFDPKTIEHLGVRMYSTLPPALAEMISTAYDADTGRVRLKFHEKMVSRYRLILLIMVMEWMQTIFRPDFWLLVGIDAPKMAITRQINMGGFLLARKA